MQNKPQTNDNGFDKTMSALVDWINENLEDLGMESQMALSGMLIELSSSVSVGVIKRFLDMQVQVHATLTDEDHEKMQKHIKEIRGRKKTIN
jgi:hypothetical protein|tara:strand:+ start:96 stop:371 length:276 start_codon:yes stop_codon:yes gene_type:complete